jgi:hypothetical protein
MADIKVVYLRDVTPISNVAETEVFNILRVFGENFHKAAEVRINGITTTFLVENDNMMLVDIPKGVDEVGNVGDIDILATELTEMSGTNRLEFALTRGPRTSSGLSKLVQQFLKVLFTTPGTNIYYPNQGGGALQLLGNTTDATGESLLVAFSEAIQRTSDQIISEQGSTDIPTDEKLLEASVLGSSFQSSKGALIGMVKLRSMAREEALANITI